MPNQPNQNPVFTHPDMKQYFDTLPKFVQETITQSGASLNTLQDLKACAENLMKKQG